eukprot:TRINITY_DN4685_c0_g1_i1.p1 TRINITY_DN4685_c0_g1~~TRINITY_DN4685_c0_g1_i1.p1  ORF type:complete len:269 (+),score=88.12 TRINITY_DN4685_c0_g1_i1:51-857(+)
MGASGAKEAELPSTLQISCEGREDMSGVYMRWAGAMREVTVKRTAEHQSSGIEVGEDSTVTKVDGAAAAAGLTAADAKGAVVMNLDALKDFDAGKEDGADLTVQLLTPAKTHNGFPAWAKDQRHILYSTAEGKWMLTDKGHAGMLKNTGFAMTSRHCEESPPHSMDWMLYSRDRKLWEASPAFAIWELKEPAFKEGQLVEYKTSQATEDWTAGIVERAGQPEDVTHGAPQQYTVVGVETKVPMECLVCCVREHAAYRRKSQDDAAQVS